jgi:hypothetical protein
MVPSEKVAPPVVAPVPPPAPPAPPVVARPPVVIPLVPIPPAPTPAVTATATTTAKPKPPLSRARKAAAAVFGVLGFGSLVMAAVMTGLDHKLAPDYSYNPQGRACTTMANAGRTCVLSTVGVYAPSYAVGALLVGGMALSLALPESRPRLPPPPQDGLP